MDKEKIITIAIGLTVGIGLAGAYFAFLKFWPKFQDSPPAAVTFVSPAPTQPSKKALTLDTPEDNITAKQSPINLAGQAAPNAKIVIFSNAEEKIVTADATGKFTTDVKLEDGENAISVSDLVNTIKRTVVLEINL